MTAAGPPPQNGIPMVNGLPSGGQQTDMNHLWGVVQQLSQMLEENRAQTLGIVNGVQAIQARAAEEGGVAGMGLREVNGELSGAYIPKHRYCNITTIALGQPRSTDLHFDKRH
jgi:hypothetical protein